MFLVAKVQGTQITILDTNDGVEETFEESVLRGYEKFGITIDGLGKRVKVSENLQSFSKKVAKSALLGKNVQAGIILKDARLVEEILSNNRIVDEIFHDANITIAETKALSNSGGVNLNCYIYVDGVHTTLKLRRIGRGRAMVNLRDSKYLIVSHKDGEILSAVMGKVRTDNRANLELEFEGFPKDNVIEIEIVNDLLQVEKQKYEVPEMCYVLRNAKKVIGKDLQYTFYSIFNNKELEVKRIV